MKFSTSADITVSVFSMSNLPNWEFCFDEHLILTLSSFVKKAYGLLPQLSDRFQQILKA
jgi:hypothetical protein